MSSQRTHSLDNLRTCLTGLVIAHHASIPYGGLGIWPYSSPHHATGTSIPIVVFNAVNQSFFMGSFFLLSGYFSSAALKRRTKIMFLEEKVKRLGVPAMAYSVFCTGVIEGILVARRGGRWEEVLNGVWMGMKSVRGARGPVWYCALVLVLDVTFALLQSSEAQEQEREHRCPLPLDTKPGPLIVGRTVFTPHVFGILILTASACFIVRLVYPIGTVFRPLSLQLGYTPQYVLYYGVGIWTHRHLQQSLDACISPRTLMHVGASAVLLTAGALQQISNKGQDSGVVELMNGGWNGLAFLYAFWNEFVGFTIGAALLKIFASLEVLKRKWTFFGMDVGHYSYAAFLLHVPVLIDTQAGLNEHAWERSHAIWKAVYVGLVGIGKSWAIGWLLKEGLDRAGLGGYL